MKQNYVFTLLTLCMLLIISCGTDDSTTPLNIETNADMISLTQNTEVEIFIFQNDQNIPSSGELTLSNASKGTLSINNNGTPNNPSDDSVLYVPNPNIIGEDAFQYTICDNGSSCQTENVTITIISSSVVNFNLENIPYTTLSEYNFFEGDIKNLNPTYGVLPYSLNSALFSDYAKKKRFIWMPNNKSASYINDNVPLDFPVGAILIKSFYYNNVLPNNETRIIETRLMIKKSEGWIFANYKWNTEQTAAVLDNTGSFVDLQWVENGTTNTVQYRIPSEAKCFTCHKKTEVPEPIGPKPRNLNLVYDYDEGSDNQLNKLVTLGYLENNLPNDIAQLPNYSDDSQPLDLRVRAYLDINCAHCHSEETHCAYRPMRFDYVDTQDFSNIGVCVDPDTDLDEELGHIVEPGDARNSVLHFRLNSTDGATRMPLIGRTLRHNEGVDLIEQWIDALTTECN